MNASKVGAVASAALLALGGLWLQAMADPAIVAKHAHRAGPSPARLPDGKPNWTGFWVPPGGLMENYRGPGGIAGAPADSTGNTTAADPTFPQLKSPYKEQYGRILEQAKKGPLPDKVALCYPPGMPGMMTMIYGMEVLQTPKIIAVTSEWQAASRRIWMDRKAHPPADELDASYAGDSIGHWEGDTLVVDTVGLRSDVPFEHRIPLKHSENTRIVERIHQTAQDILVDDVTVIDPEVFVKPWVKRYTYHYRPDLRIEEYVCLDNNRNVSEDGRQHF